MLSTEESAVAAKFLVAMATKVAVSLVFMW